MLKLLLALRGLVSMFALQKDPAEVTQKWLSRLQAAGPQIAQGVQRVTVAPGQKAAQQKAVYLQKVQSSADKWARNVARVDLPSWQNSMLNIGVPRIAQGAEAKQGKMQGFMQEFLPHVENVARQVRAMPKGTIEQGIARVTAQIRGNASFRRGGGGSIPTS